MSSLALSGVNQTACLPVSGFIVDQVTGRAASQGPRGCWEDEDAVAHSCPWQGSGLGGVKKEKGAQYVPSPTPADQHCL